MNMLRTSLHLALALTLTSLTCGLGALCAGIGESCCCLVADGGSPCTEMSGNGDTPVSPEHQGTIDSGERFSVAVVDATPPAASPDAASALPEARASRVPAAAATPLFLSHCAFLC